MNSFRNGDGHAKQIAGIAQCVADNIRDARAMAEFEECRNRHPHAHFVALRNAYVIMHATRPMRRGSK